MDVGEIGEFLSLGSWVKYGRNMERVKIVLGCRGGKWRGTCRGRGELWESLGVGVEESMG